MFKLQHSSRYFQECRKGVKMNKYMLTIQHVSQKVAYIEFNSESNEQAKLDGELIFSNYKNISSFMSNMGKGMSGNFTGAKPPIVEYHFSEWVRSKTATNAWGAPSGGYWSNI
jgi:hypothetical protein